MRGRAPAVVDLLGSHSRGSASSALSGDPLRDMRLNARRSRRVSAYEGPSHHGDDVALNVLATATATSPADCTALAPSTAFSTGPAGGAGGSQSGLVNLYVADNTIQVPIGIAANVCDVSVNVLAQGTLTGPASCDAIGNATATG